VITCFWIRAERNWISWSYSSGGSEGLLIHLSSSYLELSQDPIRNIICTIKDDKLRPEAKMLTNSKGQLHKW